MTKLREALTTRVREALDDADDPAEAAVAVLEDFLFDVLTALDDGTDPDLQEGCPHPLEKRRGHMCMACREVV